MKASLAWCRLAAITSLFTTAAFSTPILTEPNSASVLYFSRANPAGGSVVSVAIAKDGSLTNTTKTVSTNGFGRPAIAGPGLNTTVPNDPLLSQDALVVAGNYLFTVNSGSDTIVMYLIDPMDPLTLKMVGKPVSSIGGYPVSVSYSSRYQMLCALNGGTPNGVSCYHVDPVRGLTPDGVGIRNTNLSTQTPPVHEGHAFTASDIAFSPDSSRLLAIFKGPFEPVMVTAPIFLYNVSDAGIVGTKAGNASVPELSFAFSLNWNAYNQSLVYITDAVFGGVLMNIDYNTATPTLINTVYNHTSLLGSCWATYSPIYDTYYDIATLSPHIGAVAGQTGNLTKTYAYNSTQGGLDARTAGSKLYVLITDTNAIGTLDLLTGQLTQTSYFTSADQAFWVGMGLYTGPSIPRYSDRR